MELEPSQHIEYVQVDKGSLCAGIYTLSMKKLVGGVLAVIFLLSFTVSGLSPLTPSLNTLGGGCTIIDSSLFGSSSSCFNCGGVSPSALNGKYISTPDSGSPWNFRTSPDSKLVILLPNFHRKLTHEICWHLYSWLDTPIMDDHAMHWPPRPVMDMFRHVIICSKDPVPTSLLSQLNRLGTYHNIWQSSSHSFPS